MRKIALALLISALLIFSGCGGGGGTNTAPSGGSATMKLSSIPFAPYTTLAGVTVRIGIPTGSSIAITGDIPETGVISPSGVIATTGHLQFLSYSAPTSSTIGALKFLMVTPDGDNSFKRGEFASIAFKYSGNKPAADSFSLNLYGTSTSGNPALFKNFSGATLQVMP